MKPFIAFACALFVADSVLAQNYSIAIRQARNAAAKETAANQQLDNPQPATPPPPQNNPPPNPVLQATLQNIASLRNDFTALVNATGTNAPTVGKQSLTNHLAAAAQGVKASPKSISKLADDLSSVMAGNGKLRAQLPKLAQFSHAIFNGAQLTDAQQQMIFDGVQKILAGAEVSPDAVAGVVDDFKTIANETK